MRSTQLLKNVAICAFNIAIFYFLATWCLEHIRAAVVLEYLQRIPYWPILAASLVNLFGFVWYGLRLATLADLPFRVSLQIVIVGSGYNAVLPYRLGELARLYYAKRVYSVPATKLFAAGLVEKFCDLVALGGLVVVVLLFVDNSYIGTGIAVTLFGLLLAACVSVLVFRRFSLHAEVWLSGIVGMKALIGALRDHARMRHFRRISGWTLWIWTLNVAAVYVAFAALFPGAFGPGDAIVVLLIKSLAIALPTAPAGIGVFEAGIVAYLTRSLGIENELALACAIVFHLALLLPQIAYLVLVQIKPRLARADKTATG